MIINIQYIYIYDQLNSFNIYTFKKVIELILNCIKDLHGKYIYHGDLHFGNILYLDNRIYLIDFDNNLSNDEKRISDLQQFEIYTKYSKMNDDALQKFIDGYNPN